jgi:RNA polymerase sigma factor (sigma-70 family)
MNTHLHTTEPAPCAESLENCWTPLVERIRNGEIDAMEELYRVFSKGVRFFLCRQLGPQDLDDKIHELFLTVTQAIQNGDLRYPERLMGYVRTVVRRQVAAHIEVAVHSRRHQIDLDLGDGLSDQRPNPERSLIDRQNSELAHRILNSLNERDREVLVRFYLEEQPPEQICREMNLTENQFRLIKSRAKARFGALGKRRMELRHRFRFSSEVSPMGEPEEE